MDIFIARQPIFDRNKRLYAYELLHRVSSKNVYNSFDGDKATANLLINTFLNIGLDKITGSGRAFINFTEQHLLEGTALELSPDNIVVEVLEQVPPSPEIISACSHLKEKGFLLALDDFVFTDGMEPLVELADIIKVDFLEMDLREIEEQNTRFDRDKVKLLAEKIENYGQFTAALDMGFDYFQGYFFCRPEVLAKKDISLLNANLLSLLAEANKKDINLETIEKRIAADVSISYKLLRYINSAYYSLYAKVTSIGRALKYLGESGTRRFISLVAASELASDKPHELLRISLTRARFCEVLALQSSQGYDSEELFLMGLFSLLPAMLDMEMEDILQQLPLSAMVADGLLGKGSTYSPYLEAVCNYEQGGWGSCLQCLEKIDINPDTVSALYLEAINWPDTFIEAK